MSSIDSDSDCDSEYVMCSLRSNSCGLPFNPSSLENVILMISDNFNFRVVLSDGRVRGALLITTGLAVAGGFIGKHYGGKIGAMVGSAVGGTCGLGIVAVSMREIWEDVKTNLSELFDIVYDYLAGLGLEDYKKIAIFLAQNGSFNTQLAMIIMETVSSALGKKILSSLNSV